MSTRSNYKTKQKEILIEYFKKASGEHITAGDVCEHFKSKGSTIGQATVYRQLERLVDEGIIGKYVIDGVTPACFEYIGEGAHADEKMCFHCKCEKCGRLIHMHCEELEGIGEHLYEHHGFTLNPMRTVFYGICEECAAEGTHT